jgi:methionyl-tRNA formyltransferase
MSLRVLFAGTPEIAVPSLESIAAEHRVVAVLTNPDREAGRGRSTSSAPVKNRAEELGLDVLQPEKLNAAFREIVLDLAPDILVAVAYGKIFGPKFLALFSRGGLNLHPSLLPRYRGPSPINAAILAGDSETGVTIQKLAREMDAGDIILQESFPLTGKETALSLTKTAGLVGARLMRDALRLVEEDNAIFVPQAADGVSYCSLLTKDMGRIDWKKSAVEIERMMRAFTPWPGTYTIFRKQLLRILAAEVLDETSGVSERPGEAGKVLGVDKRSGILVQTGQGVLAVTELQLQSKKAMNFTAFANGVRGLDGYLMEDDE